MNQERPVDDGIPNDPPALLGEVQRVLENFENVPVVNFGWVALFILIYIVIVGPLDYFLLKRVFKRLELTWITFPAVVLVVSVARLLSPPTTSRATICAINKIDLVEYDLSAPRAGLRHDLVHAVQPAHPELHGRRGAVGAGVGRRRRPEDVDCARRRRWPPWRTPTWRSAAGSPSLFRQPYAYAEDASGLERVPIPVWSTRSFQASWRRAIDPDQPPIDGRASSPAGDATDDPNKLIGTITNNLPVELQSVTLFYRGQLLPAAQPASPGATFHVQALCDAGRSAGGQQWLNGRRRWRPTHTAWPA